MPRAVAVGERYGAFHCTFSFQVIQKYFRLPSILLEWVSFILSVVSLYR